MAVNTKAPPGQPRVQVSPSSTEKNKNRTTKKTRTWNQGNIEVSKPLGRGLPAAPEGPGWGGGGGSNRGAKEECGGPRGIEGLPLCRETPALIPGTKGSHHVWVEGDGQGRGGEQGSAGIAGVESPDMGLWSFPPAHAALAWGWSQGFGGLQAEPGWIHPLLRAQVPVGGGARAWR